MTNRSFLAAAMAVLLVRVVIADTLEVPGEFATIQAAIDAAVDGDEVLVAPGTYNERIDYLGKAITVRSSGGPEVTIIDGEGVGSGAVVKVENIVKTATLEGFDVTGGNLPNGPGIRIDGSEITISNCRIHDNEPGIDATLSTVTIEECSISSHYACGTGGGAGLSGSQISLIMTNCQIQENVVCGGYGGGLYLAESDSILTGCMITSNDVTGDDCYAYGGGLYVSGGSLTLMQCTIAGNDLTGGICAGTTAAAGGGLYLNSCETEISNCLFTNNAAHPYGKGDIVKAEGGGAIYAEGGTIVIQDSEFLQNESTEGFNPSGGALKIDSADCVLERCKFDQNRSALSSGAGRGGAIWIGRGTVTITDCSLTRNLAEDAFFGDPSGGAIYGGSPTISDSFFCSNDPDDIDAAWVDGGGNVFLKSCIDGDLDFDGDVDFDDFTLLLANWGDPGCGGPPGSPCDADIDGDGDVDFDDFTTLLANWTA